MPEPVEDREPPMPDSVARFRYRLRAGSLSLGYSLIEPELVVRDCLERIAGRLTEKFGSGVYLGEPAPLGSAAR